MLTYDELIAALRGWADLDENESGAVASALADLTQYSDAELAGLIDVAREVAEAITAGDLGDEDLEALEYLAGAVESVQATVEAREADDAERAERAAALADRITGASADDGGDDGEPGGATETEVETEVEDETDSEAETETEVEASDERVPVAASARRPRLGRVAARRPDSARAVVSSSEPTAPLVAAAGVPNAEMGARLNTAHRRGQAFADTIAAMGSMALRPGYRVPVAVARAEYDPEGYLDGNVRENRRKIESAQAPEAIAAAGGICAPPVPRFDLPSFGATSRPVLGALANYGADRGGVILPSIPRLMDLDDAVEIWTVEDDEAADPDDPESPRKPCLRIECGDDVTVVPYAVTRCVEIGNWNARTWPERIDEFLRLLEVQTARKAETELLRRIGLGSTNVNVGQYLGTARDVLTTLDLAIAGYESRHRIENGSYTWIAPVWLRRQMRSDLTREMPGSAAERLAAADVEIDRFLAARGVTVRWTLDGEAGQIFGTQADGDLNGWLPTATTYLFETGSWLGLNGGDLTLGVVRDSGLNARNSYQIFSEFWESPAFYGLESLRLSMTLCPSGATAGTVEPVCGDEDEVPEPDPGD